MEKEQMIEKSVELLKQLYYEDVEFFYGFLTSYAKKKGMRCKERGATDARCPDNS